MTDVVLPATAPIQTYIDDTVAVLAELLEGTPADVFAGFDFSAQGSWTFTRPGAPPLNPDQSLNDAAIVDGSLLTLVAVSHSERYRPLVEDVIDAIAVVDNSPEFDRSALNRFIGVAFPVVALAVTIIAVLAWRNTGHSPWWMLALGLAGLAVLAASWAAQRFYQRMNFSESLLAAAMPLIAVAVALAVPRPQGSSDAFGAPQLAAGAAAVLFLMLLTRGGPRRRIELATFTAVAAFTVTAAAIAYGYGWQRWVPAAAIVFGLFNVTNAAKLTVLIARIALPPIPAPGESVDNEELLEAVAGEEVDAEQKGRTWQAIMASVPASAEQFAERSHLAKQLLIGFVAAGSLVFAAGVISVVERGHFFVHSLVVAGLVTVACGFRSRLYAERWCAWSLLAAAVAIPIGIAAKLSLWFPSNAWLILTIYLVVLLIVLAVVAATAKAGRISPVGKRILELFDGAIVASIVPMLLWITGVYDTVRNITF